MPISRLHIGKFPPSDEVALNIVHSALYFSFVFRRVRNSGADQETIMQSQLPIRLPQDRVMYQGFDHCGFEIIWVMCPSGLCGHG